MAPVEGLPDLARDEIRNRSVKKTLPIPARPDARPIRRREALIERVGR